MKNLELENRKIKKKEKFLLNKSLIYIYFFLSFLSTYNISYKKDFLICITILSFYFIIIFILEIKRDKKINFFMIFLILSLILSLIFNISYLVYYLINISCIISCYIIAKLYKEYSLKIIFYLFSFFNFINFNFYFFLDGNFANSKQICGIIIKRKFFSFLNLSTASTIALFCIIISFFDKKYLKKYLKIFNIILSIYIILSTGKITVILCLIIIMIIIISENLIKKIKLFKAFIVTFLVLCFSSSLIFYLIKEYIPNLSNIFTGRTILWVDYWNYIISNKKNIFFGYGFFNNKISYLTHPHNQFLSIVYILGILGAGLYFFIFYKALLVSYYQEKVIFYLLICMLVLMTGDDYFILTVFPIFSLVVFKAAFFLKNNKI